MKKFSLISLVVFVVIFYLLNVIVPFYGDDYAVMYNADGSLISSIGDLLAKTEWSYFHHNGRVIPDFLMAAFSSLIGDSVFNILNTIVFALTLFFFMKVVNISLNKVSLFSVFLTIGGFFIMMFIGNLFFWGAGAANYLWPLMMTLTFLYLVKQMSNTDKNFSLLSLLGLALLSFVLGLTHEIFVLPISFSLFVYYVFNRNQLNKPLVFMLCGFFLATLFVVMSPGSFSRLDSSTHDEVFSMMNVFRRLAKVALSLKITYIFLMATIIVFFRNRRKLIEVLKENVFWCIFFAVSFVLPIVSNSGGRALLGVELSALILMIKMSERFRSENLNKWSVPLMGALFVYIAFVTYDYREKWDIIDKCQQEYLTTSKNIIVHDEYKGFAFTSRFSVNVNKTLNSDLITKPLQRYKQTLNHSTSEKIMMAIPKSLFDVIIHWDEKKNNLYKVPGNAGFYTDASLNYYVMPFDSLKKSKIEKGYLYKTQRLPLITNKGLMKNFTNGEIQAYSCPVLFLEEFHGDWILLGKYYKKHFNIECDTIGFHSVSPKNYYQLFSYSIRK